MTARGKVRRGHPPGRLRGGNLGALPVPKPTGEELGRSLCSAHGLVFLCSSDSDSEGENPEKKKLQEQLMGKPAPLTPGARDRSAPPEYSAQVSGANYLGCRCHCDGEAQRAMERRSRPGGGQGGPEGSRHPAHQIPSPVYR